MNGVIFLQVMHSKLQKMLPDIEQRLSQPDIEIFKIGKSNDSKRRFLEYEEPLHFLGIIAKGNADAINQAECDLIAHFHENAKCTNENAGGGGNENATELYIVAKKHYEQPLNDGDQLEHLLEPSSLFDFETINI